MNSSNFDFSKGKLVLDHGESIDLSITPSRLRELPFKVARDFHISTGWYHCIVESLVFVGRSTYFRFTFEKNTLKSVSFWPVDASLSETLTEEEYYEKIKREAPLRFLEYKQWLDEQMFDAAFVAHETNENYFRTSYSFTWGEIGVSYDPHNFVCTFFISWTR